MAFSYCLIPTEPCYTALSKVIDQLSVDFDAPHFSPHLTLYIGEGSEEKGREILKQLANRLPIITLKKENIDYSEKFNKSFFLNYADSELLKEQCEHIRTASAIPSLYEIHPHMSLMYKTLAPEVKEKLARGIYFDFDQTRFDKICLKQHVTPVQTREDIENIQTIAVLPLSPI